uniref:Ion transport domain-containing protein n=1 Tax=Ditylum brightwellii TaxID=49249 RepID=A0A7S2EFF3_9STRA|mmetsp:Transcript_28049/g.41736  ORF Transcript_28049/g.41736 Transcript_28049/m.41736 type:complete len:415 (+) Transcript_28049:111-1355(+)
MNNSATNIGSGESGSERKSPRLRESKLNENLRDRSNSLRSKFAKSASLKSGISESVRSLKDRQPKEIKKFRNICGRLVNDERVQAFIVFLIVANAIMMGVATFDFVTEDPEVLEIFEKIDMAFLYIFTIELALQFIYHLWHLFTNGWLLFDFIIIMMSWIFSDVQIIRAFRIFRALRLITRIEVMKNLVSALLSVVPKMLSIAALLLLVFYIFAVMFTSLFKKLNDEPDIIEYDYFGSIWDSLFTCFQFMTLDDWNPIAREVFVEYSWAWVPFIAFIVISGFIVVNLVIAVLCDAVSALHGDPDNGDGGEFLDEVWEEEDHIADMTGMDSGSVEGDGGSLSKKDHSRRPSLDSDDPIKSTVFLINNDRMVIKRKVDVMESQIEELTRLQNQTKNVLQFLTVHVKEAKERQARNS